MSVCRSVLDKVFSGRPLVWKKTEKPGNIREFNVHQGNVKEKIMSWKNVYCWLTSPFTFGATPMFSRLLQVLHRLFKGFYCLINHREHFVEYTLTLIAYW